MCMVGFLTGFIDCRDNNILVKEEKMKAKTRFLKMYYKMPEETKRGVSYYFRYPDKSIRPLSMNVIANEVRNDTQRGKDILKQLGFRDD